MGELSALTCDMAGIKQDCVTASSCASFILLLEDADDLLSYRQADPTEQAAPAELPLTNQASCHYMLRAYWRCYPSDDDCTVWFDMQLSAGLDPSSLWQQQLPAADRSFSDKRMAVNVKWNFSIRMALAQNDVVPVPLSRGEK